MRLLRRAWLPATVFVTGACVLVIEVLALKILSPYFGNTLYSASSVISVVLAALSFGYWFGGRLADRSKADVRLFFGIIAVSGLLVLFMRYLQGGLLPYLGYQLPLAVGSLVMALLLFFLPSFVLGLLSPFAVALQQKQMKQQGVGTTAGQIFFFSTLGSIAGSLATGFVLVPVFGVSAIVIGTGLALFALGIIPLAALGIGRRLTGAAVLLAIMTAIVAAGARARDGRNVVYAHDGVYEKIMIFDGSYNGRTVRFLQQDTSNSAAMYLDADDSELAYAYTYYYGLHRLFVPRVDRALVIGGGAYSIPKALLRELPDVRVDVSEIEPRLPELAKEYFRLPNDPRLTNYVQDGRRMLHDTSNRYDLIFGDAYHSMYSVPAHLTTEEFMRLVRDRLTPRGVFVANLIGSLQTDGPSFIWSEIRTMQQVFPQVYVFAVSGPGVTSAQNIIVVGSMRVERLDINDPALRQSGDPLLAGLAERYVETADLAFDRHPVLTDNYAPVDYLISKVLPGR